MFKKKFTENFDINKLFEICLYLYIFDISPLFTQFVFKKDL